MRRPRSAWRIAAYAAAAAIVTGALVGLLVAWKYRADYRTSVATQNGELRQLSSRVASLKAEQARGRVQLQAVREEIGQAELALRRAKADARRSQCLANNARLDAAITVKQVKCYKKIAEYHGCNATHAEAKSDGMIWGAIIGGGLAVVTGGASLALTGGGMLAGGAAVGSGNCGKPPTCSLDPNELETSMEGGAVKRLDCSKEVGLAAR